MSFLAPTSPFAQFAAPVARDMQLSAYTMQQYAAITNLQNLTAGQGGAAALAAAQNAYAFFTAMKENRPYTMPGASGGPCDFSMIDQTSRDNLMDQVDNFLKSLDQINAANP